MDLKLLLDNGVDLHSYQPTAEDVVSAVISSYVERQCMG